MPGIALRTKEEIDAFYREIRESVRGSAVVPILRKGLTRSNPDPYYKAFFLGRLGVGKSTELSRLLIDQKNRYVGIRFSAVYDLDPLSFKPFDVLLLAALLIVEELRKRGLEPDPNTIKPVLRWYADVKTTTTQKVDGALTAALGAGVPDSSWWHKVAGVFGSIKGEMKFTGARTVTVVDYSLNRIDTLVSAVNDLFLECRRLLWSNEAKEWILIGEEFDKQVSPALSKDLFVTYGNVLRRLDANLIFNLPLGIFTARQETTCPPSARS